MLTFKSLIFSLFILKGEIAPPPDHFSAQYSLALAL